MVTLWWIAAVLTCACVLSPSEATVTCEMSDWTSSFDSSGYSNCKYRSQYINGFYRSAEDGSGKIYQLETARCCQRTEPYWNQETTCTIADWSASLDINNRLSQCPSGYFLRGLYRGDQGAFLHNIEYGRCCKPANHGYTWGDCYMQNIEATFDKEGTSKCNDGYYVTGLYRGSCNNLNCLTQLKCCKMADESESFNTLQGAKDYIMDSTLYPLSVLANTLGYGWTAGCRASSTGDDFSRDETSWIANTNGFLGEECSGYKADDRLTIRYGDVKFALDDIVYGDSVTQTLEPSEYTTGIIRNYDTEPTTHTLEKVISSTRTVTHTTTTSTSLSHTLDLTVGYVPGSVNGGGGVQVSFNFAYEDKTTTEDSESNEQTESITLTTEKELAANSAAEYQIMMTNTRTTTPYTATVTVEFSAQFEGFLRWGGGYYGDTTNYHYQHRGSESRPTFNFKFGSASKPFYQDLYNQSMADVHPWMWTALKSKYSTVDQRIADLVDEGKYTFQITGQFEDEIGTHAEIEWKSVDINGSKRQVKRSIKKRKETPRIYPAPPIVKAYKGKPLPEIPELGDKQA